MQVMVDMMCNLMGACAAATCSALSVLLNTPSALHSRVLHVVVTPECSNAAERKHSVGEEGREGGCCRGRELNVIVCEISHVICYVILV